MVLARLSFLCSFILQTRDSVAVEMTPRRGFSPVTRVISPELSPQLTWFILSSKVCGSTLTQNFKRSLVVVSFSGPTEQEILQHLEETVELALPLDKFKKPFEDVNTAKNLILNRVTFYQARVDVSKKQLLFLYLQLDLTSCSQVHW